MRQIASALMRSHCKSPAGKQHVILTFKAWFLHVSKEDTALNRKSTASQTRMAAAGPDSRDRGSEVRF